MGIGWIGTAYSLGNLMRRPVLPEDMKHRARTSFQTRLIKTGGRLVRHARRLVFQPAKVAVRRALFQGVLDRIDQLCAAPAIGGRLRRIGWVASQGAMRSVTYHGSV